MVSKLHCSWCAAPTANTHGGRLARPLATRQLVVHPPPLLLVDCHMEDGGLVMISALCQLVVHLRIVIVCPLFLVPRHQFRTVGLHPLLLVNFVSSSSIGEGCHITDTYHHLILSSTRRRWCLTIRREEWHVTAIYLPLSSFRRTSKDLITNIMSLAFTKASR